MGVAASASTFLPRRTSTRARAAADQDLAVEFIHGDVRTTPFGDAYAVALLLSGELNTFSPEEAIDLLTRIREALLPTGRLLLEPHRPGTVERIGRCGPTWFAAESGLFSDRLHLVLTEHGWDPTVRAASTRHTVLEDGSAPVVMGERLYERCGG